MKFLFSILIFLHGAIHLMGFLKAFNLANIPQLSVPISKTTGLFWLLAFLLFTLAGVLWLTRAYWWGIIAIAAVFLSTVLTISVWREAWFAIFPNLIILTLVLFSLSRTAFNQKVSREVMQIIADNPAHESEPIASTQLSALPFPVKNWLMSSGIIGKPKVHNVWLRQKAGMKMKPGQENWHQATAEQHFTIDKPAFIWKVNMKMAPFISLSGRDKFVDGKGEMLIKMFSLINVVNENGPRIDEGTLQRYLGEMVWFPSAALSPYVSWEAIDSLSAKATMHHMGNSGTGTFYFNKHGDFVRYTALRYKGNEADAKRYLWIIDAKEHAVVNGIKIPVKMTASWELDEGIWTWLELQIEEVKYNFN